MKLFDFIKKLFSNSSDNLSDSETTEEFSLLKSPSSLPTSSLSSSDHPSYPKTYGMLVLLEE